MVRYSERDGPSVSVLVGAVGCPVGQGRRRKPYTGTREARRLLLCRLHAPAPARHLRHDTAALMPFLGVRSRCYAHHLPTNPASGLEKLFPHVYGEPSADPPEATGRWVGCLQPLPTRQAKRVSSTISIAAMSKPRARSVIGETRRGIVPRPERQRRARRSRALIYNRDTTQHERCELRKSCPWSRNDEAPMKGPRRGGMIRPCRVGLAPYTAGVWYSRAPSSDYIPRQVGCNHVQLGIPLSCIRRRPTRKGGHR